jgi:hypothetical protein
MNTRIENRLEISIDNIQIDIERWKQKMKTDSDKSWQRQIDETDSKLRQIIWIKTGVRPDKSSI